MRTKKVVAAKGFSRTCVLALALLLASCLGGGAKPKNNNYTVGGAVSGLAGAGLILQNNGGNSLPRSTNGAFTFSTTIASGGTYSVTVLIQPSSQGCTVANGTGTVTANVTNVAVNCAANAYTVGGTVSGLTGTGLKLQNNGGNDLPISADGAFVFSTAIAGGGAYSVTVLTQPSGQACTVTNGTGTVSAYVTNVAVACAAPPAAPTVGLGFGVKELQFTWAAVSGATFYRLLENHDGVSGYTQVATNITALSYNHTIPVHRRLNASYIVQACNSAGCTDSAPRILGNSLTQAIGYMKASNTGADDNFGFAVALSGDGNTLAVGAVKEDSSSTGVNSTPNEVALNAGAVYVFTKSAGTWSQQAYLKASNTGAGDCFGFSVALSSDGNTLAVGARGEASSTTGIGSTPNESASQSGAVYVFTRSGSTWSQQAYVKASNTEFNDMFGNSVALSGDGNTLAVGAPYESSDRTGVTAGDVSEAMAGNAAPYAGAVYVFTKSDGTWSQQAYVKASNTESSDMFGSSVALSGDGNTLAVGAPAEASAATGINDTQADNSAPYAGAVYVYTRGGTTWSQQAYVKASNTEFMDMFGNSVALSGDGNTLAVGAPLEASAATGINDTIIGQADNTAPYAGAVYVYARGGTTWSQQAYVKASNTQDGDNFGTSVALSGDGNTLAVGVPFEDGSSTGIGSTPNNLATDDLATDAGAVYFYARSAGTWSQQAYVKASNTGTSENDGAADQFGSSVALSGDGNALAVGAIREDSSTTGVGSAPNELATWAGAVYLY